MAKKQKVNKTQAVRDLPEGPSKGHERRNRCGIEQDKASRSRRNTSLTSRLRSNKARTAKKAAKQKAPLNRPPQLKKRQTPLPWSK